MANIVLQIATGRGVAERWRSQYQHPVDGWTVTSTGGSKEVYEKLCALGEVPTIDAVAEIIGNKSWGHIDCSSCGGSVGRAIRVKDYYEDQNFLLCSACIEEAHKIMSDSDKPDTPDNKDETHG